MRTASSTIRFLNTADLKAVEGLASVAKSEGFRFLDRLLNELEAQTLELDAADNFYLCVVHDDEIVGIGGVTHDPYADGPAVGRIRHVYIHPAHRRSGLGRLLIRKIETHARDAYSVLRLRTDTPGGARFYEALGYAAVSDRAATHVRSNV